MSILNARPIIALGSAFIFCLGATPAPIASPDARIAATRSQVLVSSSGVGGPGGDLLKAATANAAYVALGEEHGTSEIPRFADAFYQTLQPSGFNTIAVETGPLVTQRLRSWVASPNGASAFVSFERTYPGTLAFFSWRDEWAFLSHAAARSGNRFELWGLDQELMGAPGYLLTSILAEHPGKHSGDMVKAMLAKNDADYAKAAKTGSPMDMYLMQSREDDFSALVGSLHHDGDARAQRIAQGLLDTFRIYINCCNDQARLSNHERDQLMKQTFLSYEKAAPNPKRRIFFKFGEEHVYRGFNPYNYDGIGNFVSETFEGRGQSGIHILALGIAGKQTVFAGIGKWATPSYALSDNDHARFAFLAPFVAQAYPTGYTLYDLRPFRSHFSAMGITDPGFLKLVYGYDFLVLIANTTADPAIDPSVF